MIAQQADDLERKTVAILKVLSDSSHPLGGRVLARRLSNLGIDLGERAVRYHLRQMDERGFTRQVGPKDGRLITESGIEELNNALITDRIGRVAARIEALAYQSSFDSEKFDGVVPINLSLFPVNDLGQTMKVVKNVYRAGLGVSNLAALATEGEKLGEAVIPKGKIGLATMSHIVFYSALLRAGIPVDLRYGGIVQIRDKEPLRFIELVEYAGCSLDPADVFITGKMTSVISTVREGNGKILGSFCEIPAIARDNADTIITEIEKEGIRGVIMFGRIGESVCGLPVATNKVGIVLTDGLNPVAAAAESGAQIVNYPMRGIIDLKEMQSYRKLVNGYETLSA
jgi:repressor of nif and glnA expression